MNKKQIKKIIQEAWNEGDHRQPDSFGTFLDTAAEKILKAVDRTVARAVDNESARPQAIDYEPMNHGPSGTILGGKENL